MSRQPRASRGDSQRDRAAAAHLGVVADAAEQAVGDAGRAAGAARDLRRGVLGHATPRMPAERRTIFASVVGVVVVEAVDGAEAVAQGRADHRVAGRRADEGEPRHGEADAARARPLADHEVEGEVLHRRVEDLLDGAGEAVDLVDEEDVALLEVREDRGEVAGALDRRAGGGADWRRPSRWRRCSRGSSCRGRAGRRGARGRGVLAALARGLDGDAEVLLDAVLAGELIEPARAEGDLASASSGRTTG